MHGSGDLLQTLLAAGLVDELRVLTFPVRARVGQAAVRGRGGADRVRGGLEPAFATGVVMSVYRAAGQPRTGTFGG